MSSTWTLRRTYGSCSDHLNVLHPVLAQALLAGLPYLAMWIFSNISSVVVDYIIEREILSTTFIRKIANTVACLGPAVALLGKFIRIEYLNVVQKVLSKIQIPINN